MYQVLYRKWRPTVFSDVVGQPQVTVTLKNELKTGHISHAYLFTGSRGTGKTTCAKILAKAVNCLAPQDGDPCGVCEMCVGIDNGTVMDILEIDAASNNGVDNIRALREEAAFTPAAAKYRVYIIDEVHMLSISAFNALLKTLEEPPRHVLFILATTEVHKIPATILSRCQRFDFRRIAPAEIAGRLRYIIGEEGGEIDEPAALLIARLADGAMRDALSLLDQCLSGTRHITEETVRKTAGVAGREFLFRIADSIIEKESPAAMEILDTLYTASKDMTRLCEEITAHFRALMLVKTIKHAGEILTVPEEELALLREQAKKISLAEILHCLEVMQATTDRMAFGGNRRTILEMALIRLSTAEVNEHSLWERVTALEKKIKEMHVSPGKETPPAKRRETEKQVPLLPVEPEEQVPQVPIPREETVPPPAKINRSVPAEQGESLPAASLPEKEPAQRPAAHEELVKTAEKLEQWPEILQTLKGYSQAIAMAFGGSIAYVSGNYVLIDAPQEIAFELLRKSEQRNKMRDVIRQITGKTYHLGPYKKPEQQQKAKDSLEVFAEQAREAGIQVIEKTGDDEE